MSENQSINQSVSLFFANSKK